MKRAVKKIRVGVLGCGAIGSRLALNIEKDLGKLCRLTGIFDCDHQKTLALAKTLERRDVVKNSLDALIRSCDLMIEAVNAEHTEDMLAKAIGAQRHVLSMSVGKLLGKDRLFKLAARNRTSFLVPSGALAGIDALKAASLTKIRSITLTTRKPPAGFQNNPYLKKKNIDTSRTSGETVLFDGKVKDAVRYFPQNINVAATLALAAQCADKLRVRIIVSPQFKNNSHEVEVIGDFGKMVSRTENIPCPDNPKTSYLAVLSALRMLKDFCSGERIGT